MERVVRISEKYRLSGVNKGQLGGLGFTYNGVRFDTETFHVFAGLCVDNPTHVGKMMQRFSGWGWSRLAWEPTSQGEPIRFSRARQDVLALRL